MKSKAIKKQSISEGATVLLLATVIVKLIGALFKLPLSSDKILGDLGFGYFSSAYDLFTPVYTLAISGIPVAVSKIIADFTAQKKTDNVKKVFKSALGIFFILGTVLAALMLILSFPFVKLTDPSGKSIYSMLAVAPSFILCFTASVLRGYFEGLHNMSIAAVSNVIEALGKLALGLIFAVLTLKFTQSTALAAAAAMVGITVGTLLSLIYLLILYKRTASSPKTAKTESALKDKEIVKLIFLISLPVVFASMSNSIISLIDAVTVRWQLSSMDLSGIYSDIVTDQKLLPTYLYGIKAKAYTVYNLIPTVTVAIGISAIPAITESYTLKDRISLSDSCNSSLKLSAVITLPAAVGFTVLSKNIMALLFGEGPSAIIGGNMLFIYGIAVAFAGISIPLCCILQGLNRQREAFFIVLFGIGLKVALNIVLCIIPTLNIYGAVISTLVCNAVIFILHITVLFKVMKPDLKNTILKPFISAVFCGITAYLFTFFGNSKPLIILSITAGAIIYLLSIVNLSVFSEKEIQNLPAGKFLFQLFNKLKIVK